MITASSGSTPASNKPGHGAGQRDQPDNLRALHLGDESRAGRPRRHEAHDLTAGEPEGQRGLDLTDPVAAQPHRLVHSQDRRRHGVADSDARDHNHGDGLVGQHSEAEGHAQADRGRCSTTATVTGASQGIRAAVRREARLRTTTLATAIMATTHAAASQLAAADSKIRASTAPTASSCAAARTAATPTSRPMRSPSAHPSTSAITTSDSDAATTGQPTTSKPSTPPLCQPALATGVVEARVRRPSSALRHGY